MLILDKIYKKYNNSLVIENISFSLKEGESLCVAGPNGAGKSTLLSIAAGVIKPDKGYISYDKGSIGYVPQENALFEELSVKDNLLFWYAAYNLDKNNLFSENSIETLMGLGAYKNKKVSKLSGGMKKRLSIAIAMCHNPKYIILDEPCNGLDIIYKNEIINYLKLLKSMGISIIFSSHSSYEIKELSDRLLLLKNGRSIYFDSIKDIIKDENINFDKFLVDKIM